MIAIDAKCLRRSHDQSSNKSAIYMVSAWSHDNQLALGQVKVDEKSNEITALKGNQSTLHDDVILFFCKSPSK
jgi:hypothetical protein